MTDIIWTVLKFSFFCDDNNKCVFSLLKVQRTKWSWKLIDGMLITAQNDGHDYYWFGHEVKRKKISFAYLTQANQLFKQFPPLFALVETIKNLPLPLLFVCQMLLFKLLLCTVLRTLKLNFGNSSIIFRWS
jgi:hypothetical protein